MDFNLPGPEQMIECPFNKAHLVVAHRMPHHLVKCARSTSKAGTKECKFNPNHVYPTAKVAEHEKSCPDRLEVELFQMSAAKVTPLQASDSVVSTAASSILNNDDDDWDLTNDQSYNPLDAIQQRDVVRHAQHTTPSERKKFRLDEAKRLTALRAAQENESKSPDV